MNVTPIEAVFEQFTTSLASVFSQALTPGWHANMSAQEAEAECVIVRFSAVAPLAGELLISMPREHAVRLADLFLGNGADTAGEWTSERQEALDELLRQVVGDVQTSLKPRAVAIAFTFKAEPPAKSATGEKRTYECRSDAGESLSFIVIITPELAAALGEAPRPSAPPPLPVPRVGELDSSLELLMDVELAATLRFGRRRMVMREILELNSGAVVELDRQVQEPVELLIDGKVVARGELVIVDGSYGIRVTQVLAPSQRMGLVS